jgi:outer membrane cobalamin receptor
MTRYGVLTLLLLLFIVHAWSQPVTDSVRIGEVRVLAKRKVQEAGLKITRPDSMQRVSMLTTDLSELIGDYSPVFVKSYGRGSAATASFRGAAASHTQVLWNGMNLNSPMRGITDLSLLPVFFTDDVYLLHGGSSMTRGSGALGGSIHLENIPDWDSRLKLEALSETGSFHSRKSFFRMNAGGKSLQSSTRIFYESSDNDFPFYNAGVLPKRSDTLSNAEYRKEGILQEFYLRSYNNSISGIRIWYQNNHRNLPQLMSYEGSTREEYQRDRQFRLQYDWKKYSNGLNYHFFTGYSTSRLEYYRATPAFDFVNEDSRSREDGLMNHLRIFRTFDEKTYITFSVDANYLTVRADDHIRAGGYNKNRFETSIMTNLHLKPSDRLAFFILMRSENYEGKVVPLIPSAGLEWQFIRNLPVVVRSNAARNYHKPTLNDQYWVPGGNPNLLPENGFTGDVSLAGDFSLGRMNLKNEITGYMSLIDNWILWQPSASGGYYWEANNVKEVFSRGIEYQFTAAVTLNRIILRSGGNYSFTAASNVHAAESVDESRGKQLIYIPKNQGGIYFSFGWQKFLIKYDINGVGKRYTTSNNNEAGFEHVLNPYILSRISLEKEVSMNQISLSLKTRIENLFDQDYQSILWRPMPGRSYHFAAAIKFRKE